MTKPIRNRVPLGDKPQTMELLGKLSREQRIDFLLWVLQQMAWERERQSMNRGQADVQGRYLGAGNRKAGRVETVAGTGVPVGR